jgi:hypothetical protein
VRNSSSIMTALDAIHSPLVQGEREETTAPCHGQNPGSDCTDIADIKRGASEAATEAWRLRMDGREDDPQRAARSLENFPVPRAPKMRSQRSFVKARSDPRRGWIHSDVRD